MNGQPHNLLTLAYRAEAKCDSDRLFDLAVDAGFAISRFHIESGSGGIGVLVELDTAASLGDLLALIEQIPDGHVMYRTIREGTLAGGGLDNYVRVES